jgi:hypothetical protein
MTCRTDRFALRAPIDTQKFNALLAEVRISGQDIFW